LANEITRKHNVFDMDMYIDEVSRQLKNYRAESKIVEDLSIFDKPVRTYSLTYPFCGKKQGFVFNLYEICEIIEESHPETKTVPISHFHGIHDKKGPHVYNPLDQGVEDIPYDPDKVITAAH